MNNKNRQNKQNEEGPNQSPARDARIKFYKVVINSLRHITAEGRICNTPTGKENHPPPHQRRPGPDDTQNSGFVTAKTGDAPSTTAGFVLRNEGFSGATPVKAERWSLFSFDVESSQVSPSPPYRALLDLGKIWYGGNTCKQLI